MLEYDMHLDVSTSPATIEWGSPDDCGGMPQSEPLVEKPKKHPLPPSPDNQPFLGDVSLSSEPFTIPPLVDSQLSAFPWLENEPDTSPSPGMETVIRQRFSDSGDFLTNLPSNPSEHGQTFNDGHEKIFITEFLSASLSLFPSDTEPSAIHHFKTYMTSTLSVKNAQWNIFSHFLASSKANTYSPIRSSIIAWAAAHHGLEGQNASDEYLGHYAQASTEMDALTAFLVGKNDWRQEQMGVVLATAYFLSHCDLVTGNMSGLVSRLDSIRELIRGRWDLLSSGLTGVSARLLLWLAYLDLRRSVFLPKGGQGDTIIGIIGNQESLPRLYLRSRLYLKEAFGVSYPSLELRDDMIQDPVNLKFAEGMYTLGRILQHARDGHENAPELRDDLENLHSETIELERECDLALQGFHSGGSISITRTSYHWLNLKATTQCGLILLSRMRNPSCRTDDEAQSAAYKILKITIQLRKANKLHNPHSVFSVLPIFLAGIETFDEVHQDWIMRFLEDSRGWGLHVQRAAQVLQRAVERQKQTGCRLGFKEIADLASEQLVL
ncbi:unnamed protein product [Clonostachys chloroleuca]|uniref:Uncharacterized protein n=1 Tax=Clonostachys chloroleuca TaxID=1926264 RepID=A0AA35LQ92_9HYPO|nr:unnamed protein product [Clonostachys chloroleuca]